jgi:hypothetical protein
MNEQSGIVIAIVVGVILLVGILLLVIPEPAERAVIATERLDVAVLAFGNSSSWRGADGRGPGETLRGRVESRLVGETGINVFSRAQLDALLIERALGTSGIIDPATAVEIGTLTGVSKLVTGAVYAVDTLSEPTTLCVRWQDGNCAEEVAAVKYSVRVLAQVEVIDARTGKIEQSTDTTGSSDTTLRQGVSFGSFDSLIASAADQIADQVASRLTSTYTRELRYGLYDSVKTKGDGYVGKSDTTRFSTSDDAQLIVHFVRVRNGDSFDVQWIDPSGAILDRTEDVVSNGEWQLYTWNLAGRAPGRYHVTGSIAGTPAFDAPFTVGP